VKVNIERPVTEADREAARLYSTRRHLREVRDAYYDAADRCLSRGDLAGHAKQHAKAAALEDRIAELNGQLAGFEIW
jgi:hypothetical protein